jgi:diphosphomevalonate decarboxylase
LKSILHAYGDDIALHVESVNNFPTACGVASSAAGYAALVGALADLLGLRRFMSESEVQFWLSEWARLGSGSATRSAVATQSPPATQFVSWELAADGVSSVTTEVAAHSKFSEIQHCVLVLDAAEKTVGSSEGHLLAQTSLLQDIRLAHYPRRLADFRVALGSGDFRTIQQLSELDAFEMHAVMASGATRLEYMNKKTVQAIANFIALRDAHSTSMLWTLDAGANPHFLFLPDAAPRMSEFFEMLSRDSSFSTAKVLYGQASGSSLELGESPAIREALRCKQSGLQLKEMSLAEAAVFFAGELHHAAR